MEFRAFVKGRKKADSVEVWVVPGSKQVEKQAQDEGIHRIFEEAGFILRQPGCSACLGMNEDKIPAGKYCISTSNRNFEGRQGPNARTFLASPLTAAAAAITGVVTDVREMLVINNWRQYIWNASHACLFSNSVSVNFIIQKGT